MFTKKELPILHDALTKYQGTYGKNYKNKKLTIDEIKHHEKSIKIAQLLINRIETLILKG